jgi:hypothetical protein
LPENSNWPTTDGRKSSDGLSNRGQNRQFALGLTPFAGISLKIYRLGVDREEGMKFNGFSVETQYQLEKRGKWNYGREDWHDEDSAQDALPRVPPRE